MDGNATRQRIDQIQERIDYLIGKFVLTTEIEELMQERNKIQNDCIHTFQDGKCIFCDKLEKES